MFRGCRRPDRFLWIAMLALLMGLRAMSGHAQGTQQSALPSAPEPQVVALASPTRLDADDVELEAVQANPIQAGSQTAPEPTDARVTMAAHTWRNYWLSGQANIIYQGRIPFHSPYQGPNSFR